MLFKDIFESTNDSMYDPEDDKSVYKITDTRKPKLTLQALNNLRKYREFKAKEDQNRDANVAALYKSSHAAPNNGEM
ncbi:hypothetical protein [Klebsiella phage phiKp_21]|uniref:Uncharacterized protein n=1 Tax=Klebsiella phage vB_KleM_RaK2 TaxID=1147094 RepID=H6X3P7_9CAUD|nr:hypothetical protein F403_gp445 [Klebsiella phage vB_KleM_RaK2]YP_010843004.1 hypothetical protein ACQ27_gp120 [Klebsiella phage K64-1]QOE32500.1 hypothetical protein CPT_Muenster_328 [Klebsiella phage Muenster]UYL05524.1 hypothetical protein DIDNDMLP_00539 [Klebsiella phage KP13-7]BEH88390.1 hypothetical protein [Klebsiella phage phiKp_21]AFA44363.1 hypothetical protein RaK2_00090 [Klebsiella phage vB_KleM_RaK2]